MGHVYVVASGYSRRVVPADVPFEFAVSADDMLIATPAWSGAPPSRRVAPDAPREQDASADPVADVLDGPTRREWWLETTVYSVPLPRGWTATVSGGVSPAFDLVRGNGAIEAMITGQGPADESPEISAIQEELGRRAEFA